MGNKNYNLGPMIKLEDIPKEDYEKALDDFSEGVIGLRNCLIIMWKHNLKTIACTPGKENSFKEAYILMDTNVDIFSYLSEDILLSDMVSISCNKDNRQAIHFVGTDENKEYYFNTITRDILTGKKDNARLVQEKLGKPINQDWQVHGIVYGMLKDLIPNVGPVKRLRLFCLCRKLNEGTMEEQKAIINDCYKELANIEYTKSRNR